MHDGQFEMGDDYAVNIRRHGYLVQADDGWLEAYPDCKETKDYEFMKRVNLLKSVSH